ncbi:MAG: hypothetical protein JO082_01195 [Mycobacterium sp.]|nr:hypothetical protein [Mycobacterium sp.]MBV9720520.1 hypothetical protein [Mycobacterium sp.]
MTTNAVVSALAPGTGSALGIGAERVDPAPVIRHRLFPSSWLSTVPQ